MYPTQSGLGRRYIIPGINKKNKNRFGNRSKIGLLYQEEISQCQQILLFLQRYQTVNEKDEEEASQEETNEVTEIDGMKVVTKK